MPITRRAAIALAGVAPWRSWGQSPSNLNLESFDLAWQLVRDRHWDPGMNGVDWDAVKRELRPKVESASSRAEARRTIREMLSRLKQSHFGVVNGEVYQEVSDGGPDGDATAGISVRVLDGEAVVTEVRNQPDLRTGWLVKRIGEWDVSAAMREIAKSVSDPVMRTLLEAGIMGRRLKGREGSERLIEFVDHRGSTVRKPVRLVAQPGRLAAFGLMPPTPVWLESREPKPGIGLIHFNLFLDPAKLMADFEAAVRKFQKAKGIVIDLRGNPGGLGIMAMGLAGWFIDQEDIFLGTMIMRESRLRFVVNPRPLVFGGPLAILLDPLSASTTEIFAGGLKDNGRARIFGERSAGLALPSHFQKLPNGDVVQFAFANYVSASGVPLEGHGVEPHVLAPPTRAALLEDRDNALETAMDWIEKEGSTSNAKAA